MTHLDYIDLITLIGQRDEVSRSARKKRRAERKLHSQNGKENAGEELGEGVVEKVHDGWVLMPGKRVEEVTLVS
jgi:hypothetical protein